jgi:hypothetical protein
MSGLGRCRILLALGVGLAAMAAPVATLAGKATPPSQDLTGVWTNAWYTHLERPAAIKGLVPTSAEAEAFEAPRRQLHGELSSKEDVLGQNESEFPDNGPGLARIRGELRSSWIVEPADGKLPWRPDAKAHRKVGQPSDDYDNVEARDTEERCLTNPGTAAPILNDHDANLVQFVQTGDRRSGGELAIFGEKNHQVRIVRIQGETASAPPPDPRAAGIREWLGTSVGRWEGATLVVETDGFRPGITLVNRQLLLSEHAKVVERFTRSGPGEIAYGFEVEDPTLYTGRIRGEMVFRKSEGRMFEYACHEGNYALPGILKAARAAEREKAGGGGK